jgi:hypothetical protein
MQCTMKHSYNLSTNHLNGVSPMPNIDTQSFNIGDIVIISSDMSLVTYNRFSNMIGQITNIIPYENDVRYIVQFQSSVEAFQKNEMFHSW